MPGRPLIGVPADRRTVDPHPFHMVGEKYLQALIDGADAMPAVLPVLSGLVADDWLDRLDGILLTGSPSNVEPHHYGGAPSEAGTMHDPHRDAVTLPLAKAALERDLPLLALCRGHQELNVVLGGTLHQKVHEVAGFGCHKENPEDPLDVQYGPAHAVNLVDGGMLHRLAGVDRVMVNSLHAQSVAKLADGVSVEAIAEDGLVEAFRVDRASFALSIQWHPEWQMTEDPFSTAIFNAFGVACRAYAARDR